MDTDATVPAAPMATNGASSASVVEPSPTPVAATPSTFGASASIPTQAQQAAAGAAPASNGSTPTPSSMPPFSAATAELIARARANAVANGQPGFEEARAALMKTMTMSDRLPVPAASAAPKRGRGGRGGGARKSLDARSASESTPGSASVAAGTPGSESKRGKGGRGRGRGRGGGRGGKRKRSESVDSEVSLFYSIPLHTSLCSYSPQLCQPQHANTSYSTQDLHLTDSDADPSKTSDAASDISASASFTPLPKVTKSGRSINKPTQYVPTIPEPTPQPNKKKRTYNRRNIDAAVCKMCHRPTSPTNNQIVFCDGCGAAYHQYCHDPPIEREVVEVAEKEWFCGECVRSRTSPEKGDEEGCVSGESLTMDEVCFVPFHLPSS